LRITTQRLLLEPVTVHDATLILSGDREANWCIDYPTPGDEVIAHFILNRPEMATAEFGPMKVVVGETNLVVGGCGFLGPPDAEGSVEIGYGLAPSHRGRGIATEAVAGMVHSAFASPGVRLVWAGTEEQDTASQGVLTRNGFRMIGTEDGLRRYELRRPQDSKR
jgi:ribosomal-protein-alanine N-acetyltransferase